MIGVEGTAILAPYSFEMLLGDVGVSFDHVKKDIVTVRRALARSIKLTPAAERALLAESSRTRANAKRLRLLPDRLKAIYLDAPSLRTSLLAHDVDPNLVLDGDDQFSFDQKGVGVFLDAIEGRFFEDDLGGERRRADRYSTR